MKVIVLYPDMYFVCGLLVIFSEFIPYCFSVVA